MDPSFKQPELTQVADSVNSQVNTMEIDLTSPPIVFEIYDNQIIVKSNNVNTVYNVDANEVFVTRGNSGLVEYIRVNDAVLFRESKYQTNHVYQYLDNNTIIVSKGNTIDGIIADHMELKLTKKDLLQCNPFLNRGLQIGDRIKLLCD
jgi:hypothetical protein